MIRFRRFESDIAVFRIGEKITKLTKKETQTLHDNNKRVCDKKGTCPDAEQTKFALDRWPGTDLARKIAKQKRPD